MGMPQLFLFQSVLNPASAESEVSINYLEIMLWPQPSFFNLYPLQLFRPEMPAFGHVSQGRTGYSGCVLYGAEINCQLSTLWYQVA